MRGIARLMLLQALSLARFMVPQALPLTRLVLARAARLVRGLLLGALVLAALTPLLAGCLSSGSIADSDAQRRQAANEQRLSEDAARKQAAASHELEERLARQQLMLFEKDAEIRSLNEKLEAAILEVVRAMAKLRGLSGRAEAASSLAETEVALKSLPGDPASRPKDSDLHQARQLLKLATEEFKKQNYDGTLYLTSEVKALIKTRNDHADRGGKAPKTDGEVGLAVSLAVRATNRTNVREGPGPSFKILFVVDRGTPLTAWSYNGVWVRVKTDDGRGGWVHYTLLDQR